MPINFHESYITTLWFCWWKTMFHTKWLWEMVVQPPSDCVLVFCSYGNNFLHEWCKFLHQLLHYGSNCSLSYAYISMQSHEFPRKCRRTWQTIAWPLTNNLSGSCHVPHVINECVTNSLSKVYKDCMQCEVSITWTDVEWLRTVKIATNAILRAQYEVSHFTWPKGNTYIHTYSMFTLTYLL